MKRVLYILAFIFFGLFGVVNEGWSDSYTIEFYNSSKSESDLTSSTMATTIVSDGTSYVTTQPFTVNSGKCYYGGGSSGQVVRIGKSGENANLSIELSSSGQVTASTIVVSCKKMSGSKNTSATLSVNGTTPQSPAASTDNLTFTINDDITEITLTSVKSVLIYSITVNHSSTPTPTKYTVTYNANGGTGTVTDVTEYDPNAIVTTLNNTFLKNDSIFDNWNTKSDGTGSDIDEGSTFTITKDTTLYAKWLKNVIGKSNECNIFYESFDGNAGETQYSGGNDGRWNGSGTANATPVMLDNEGWIFHDDNGKGGDRCIRLGTGSKAGDAETTAITYTETQPLLLTFKAGAWDGTNEHDTIILTSTNCNLSDTAVKLEKGKWGVYNILLTSVSNNFKIKWQSKYVSNNRFFLDSICISSLETPIDVVSWYKDSIFLSKDYFKEINFSAEKIRIKPIQSKVSLVNMADSTLKASVDLSSSYCDTLHFIVCNDTTALEQRIKIPYIISSNTNIPDIDDDCNVVISSKAVLTVNTDSKNKDVYVYPNGTLNIPFGKTYTINSLTLRRDNELVPYLSYNGTLDIQNDFNIELRMDANNWYWTSLPFEFKPSMLKKSNGEAPNLHDEYYIEYYDGANRAHNQTRSFRYLTNDSTFVAGHGFAIHLGTDHTGKHIYTIPFEKDSLLHELNATKTITGLHAWQGGNVNDRGWNLIGNPYMNAISLNDGSIRTDTLEKIISNGQWTGGWELTEANNLRYIIVCNLDGTYSYQLIGDGNYIKPFTSFFVQLDGNNENEMGVSFIKANQKASLVARKNISTDNDEIFLRIDVGNYKTGCFISDEYTDEYEIGYDLSPFENDNSVKLYQYINGYKLLYSAVNDSIIEHGIKVYTPIGNLHLDDKTNVEYFEEIYAFYNDEWIDLLHGQTQNVSGEFILFAKRKTQVDIPTDIDIIKDNNKVIKFMHNNSLYIKKNNHLYNILGGIVK